MYLCLVATIKTYLIWFDDNNKVRLGSNDRLEIVETSMQCLTKVL